MSAEVIRRSVFNAARKCGTPFLSLSSSHSFSLARFVAGTRTFGRICVSHTRTIGILRGITIARELRHSVAANVVSRTRGLLLHDSQDTRYFNVD